MCASILTSILASFLPCPLLVSGAAAPLMRCSWALPLPPLPPAGFRSCCTAHKKQTLGTPPPLLVPNREPRAGAEPPGSVAGRCQLSEIHHVHFRAGTAAPSPLPPSFYRPPLGSGAAGPSSQFHHIRDPSCASAPPNGYRPPSLVPHWVLELHQGSSSRGWRGGEFQAIAAPDAWERARARGGPGRRMLGHSGA